MRFPTRIPFATIERRRAAAALAALFLVAAPVAAQSLIEVPAENATVRAGKWAVTTDSTASGGGRTMRHPDQGASKITSAKTSPTDYFEVTFNAVAGVPYQLVILGKADQNYWGNDSVFVQFSGSVSSSGSSKWRIGTTSATEVNLEDCSGCGLSGWKWQDNGYGLNVVAERVYFATTGSQRMRIQTREDGLSIDHIHLIPEAATTTTTTTTAASSSSSLKVLDWNTHHGIGTDGRYDITRFIPYIVNSGANVVSLNEVEKNVGSYGSEDQPARYASLLKSATGKTWYYKFAQRDGNTNGQGNLLLTTFPIEDSDAYKLSYSRSVSRIQILVNGIRVNVFSTHLDADSSSRRATQMKELNSWASGFAEQRIQAGDYNAWPGAGEIANMTSGHIDTWAYAKTAGTAVAYSGNEAGNTRNSRIDYVWLSKSATRTTIKASRVFDVRNSSGVAPSDHRPVMTTFEVK
jgi:endonuclease/exonuclease/phosphatase family metal-dependent hydrolase